MVQANIKIIEELQYFLEAVAEEPQIRKLVTESDTDFSRDRKLTLQRVAGIIINMPKRSLRVEIQAFFDTISHNMDGCTKGAFSLQRSKLKPLFFEVWNKWLADHFYAIYGERAKKWRGFRLQAIDGSSVYLPDKPQIAAHFGCHGNQHGSVPMGRVVQVYDVLNELVVWGGIYPTTKSERAIMSGRVPHLAKDSLTIMDRGFAGFGLMYLMLHEEEPRHFVIRCKSGFNKEVTAFARGSKRSKIVALRPSYKSIAMLRENDYIITPQTTISVRMVEVNLPNGEQEILLTSLCDETLYSNDELKYLYGLRWGIETAYGKQKGQVQMEQFSGHRVLCVQQDYAATLFACNLQSLIEKQSEDYLRQISQRRKHPCKINRNVSWASLKGNIVLLLLTTNVAGILNRLQKAFESNLEPVRPGRQVERPEKSRRMTGKFQTFSNFKRAI